jgi:hypothetical protein
MAEGGFDVVIGNPPYVVYSRGNVEYHLAPMGLSSLDADNLYAFVFERSLNIGKPDAPISLIVQLTAITSGKMRTLQDLLIGRGLLVVLPYPRRPESMFDGVEMPVVIIASYPRTERGLATTRVGRMYGEERPVCLETHAIASHRIRLHGHRIAKLGCVVEKHIIQNVLTQQQVAQMLVVRDSDFPVYYQEACRYWLKAQDGLPFFSRNGVQMQPPHGRIFFAANAEAAAFFGCLLNSSLFYWYYSLFSDCEHVNDDLVKTLPIPTHWNSEDWKKLSEQLFF